MNLTRSRISARAPTQSNGAFALVGSDFHDIAGRRRVTRQPVKRLRLIRIHGAGNVIQSIQHQLFFVVARNFEETRCGIDKLLPGIGLPKASVPVRL
jgi:hypothetical protein